MKNTTRHPTRTTRSGRSDDRDPAQVLLVRKPEGWTSFDVVRKLRRLLRVRKAGHAGTLDPMATGLLIVCTGSKTKEISRYQGMEKEYRVRMVLGARTASFDAETPVTERRGTEAITEVQIREVLSSFVGPQVQTPPMWSAAKVGGTRLYKLARKGQTVERTPREIFIRSITLVRIEMPAVDFVITCSKGTYVRTLVDDVGTRLGCGAYVAALERTRIGEFRLEDAVSIEDGALLAGRSRVDPI